MPIGKVKWYDAERGFGFVSNPGEEDCYVGRSVLPEGVTELHPGQRIEFDFAAGRRGPQALRVEILETPRVAKRQRKAAARKHSPEELHGMVSDMVTLLEQQIQPDLRTGRWPDRRSGRQVADILRAVARELDA